MVTCPYYKQGLCFSPLLLATEGKPVDWPVSKERCLGKYIACNFYDKANEKQSQTSPIATTTTATEATTTATTTSHTDAWYGVNFLVKKPESNCEKFRVKEESQGEVKYYVATCIVLRRLLTTSEVENCVKYFSTCPFNLFQKTNDKTDSKPPGRGGSQ